MKNNNPDIMELSTASCKPSKKVIKARLKSAKEAKDMMDDLAKNNHFPYPIDEQVRGYILLRIE